MDLKTWNEHVRTRHEPREPRIDWSEVKGRTDLAGVATNLLGPAHQRKGKRLLWPCPFHDDHDPSFQVDLTRKSWRYWTCAVGGDAADLVQRVNHCDFPAAVKFLADLSGDDFPLEGNGTRSRRRQAPGEAAGEAVRLALGRRQRPS